MGLLRDKVSRGVRAWRKRSAIYDSEQPAFAIDKRILSPRGFAVEAHFVFVRLVAMNKAQLVPNFFGTAIRTRARLASALESVFPNLGKHRPPGAIAGDDNYALGNLLRRDLFRLIAAFGLLRRFGLRRRFGLFLGFGLLRLLRARR